MESFTRNTSTFSVCQHRPCLIFKEIGTYVSVESNNFTRYPFRFENSMAKYRNTLRGPFFNFLQNIPALNDSYLIYAGDECSFDDQIKFLTEARALKQGHQFIVSGLMFILRYRINNDSIPSMPFTNGPIVIVGPTESRHFTFIDTLEAFSRPLEVTTWISILNVLLILSVVRIGISLTFTVPLNWLPFWMNVWGLYEEAEEQRNFNPNIQPDAHDFPLDEQENLRYRSALQFYNKYWTTSVKVFFVLTVLFYELALFNHVFELLNRPPQRNIQRLSEDEMKRFVLVKNSGYEWYFRLAADSKRKYEDADDVDIPWQQVETVADAYKSMMENGTFSVFSDRSSIVQMKSNNACNKLSFYETDANRFYNGGWYYSADVPQKTRLMIDKSITKLVEHGRAREILDEEDDDAYRSCGRKQTKIEFMLLFLLLLPLSLLTLIGIIIRLTCHNILKIWRRRLWLD